MAIDKKIPPGLKLRKTLKGHQAAIYSLAWSPDGKLLASAGSRDNKLMIWNTETESPTTVIERQGGRPFCLSWSPDSSSLAIATENDAVELWNVTQNAKRSKVLRGHTHWVYAVAWSPNGNLIASGSRDNTIRLWDAKTGTIINIFNPSCYLEF